MQKKILISIVGIVVVIAVVFFSQKAYSMKSGKNLISDATNQAKTYLSKGSDWVKSKIYPTISGEVQKRGDMIRNEVNQEKNKVTESIGKKIENYFSGITDSILHPGTPQNCAPAQPSQPAQNP